MIAILLAISLLFAGARPPIVDAAKNGDKESLRTLLKQAGNVNAADADGTTALHWASYRDDVEAADLLIRAGAKVNVTNDLGAEARKVIDRMKARTGIEMTEQEIIDSPHIFIGSIERFVEKLTELRELLGINSFLVGSLDELGPVVERLAGT